MEENKILKFIPSLKPKKIWRFELEEVWNSFGTFKALSFLKAKADLHDVP